jgi:uncharacterized protein (DUF3084 family)
MLDSLSLAAASTLAKIVLDKFYAGAGQKLEETAKHLGEAAVAKVNEKIKQLGSLIWQRCFKGKPQDVAQLPEQAAQGNESELHKLAEYLSKVLEQNDEFTAQVKQLAGEIHQVVFEMKDINAQNVQQNFDRQNTQVNAPNTNVINIGEGSTVHLGIPSQG